MTKTTKQVPAPRLRFPGFVGEWEEKKLGEVCQINPPTGKLPDEFVYIDLESVEGGNLLSRKVINSKSSPSRAQRVLRYGDIIFQTVRPYQKNNLLFEFEDDYTYVASTGYAQLRVKGSNQFIYQSIYHEDFVDRVVAKCTGSNYPAINSSDLAEIALFIPSLPEQTRIAAALSSLDAVIAAHQSKQGALREHKRGLMAGLFPAEGERVPRLRFPEFEGAGEWEEKKLGELGTLVSGLTYHPDDVRTEGLLVLRSSNIQNGKISLEDCVYVRPDIKGANLSKKGDILICVRNGSTSLIGKNALIPDDLPLATHGAFMTVFRSDLPEFCHSLFQTDRYSRLVANDLGATINSRVWAGFPRLQSWEG